MDNYFQRAEISNSDLNWLNKYFLPPERVYDIQKAYDFGSLIDAMITEPHKVDHFTRTWEQVKYSSEDFDMAKAMRQAFFDDPFCISLSKTCSFQHVTTVEKFEIEYNGIRFWIPARCKWDLHGKGIDLGGDIKSTVCTTEKACRAALEHFNYDQSRAFYMDLGKKNNDILIFISKEKKPKIFKIPIKRGDEIYERGRAKYSELAFRWVLMFGDLEKQIIG